MTHKWFPVLLQMLWLVFHGSACAADASGFDLVTMKNGEIHNGTVAMESFVIETSYGAVSVPYKLMQELHFGHGRDADRLRTKRGDTFSGRIRETEFTMLRVLDTTLPLSVADMVSVSFGNRPLVIRKSLPADAVEMRTGDRFFARIINDDIVISGESPQQAVSHQDIDRIDFAVLMDGEERLTQVTLKQGQVLQGALSPGGFQVETLFGQILEIPAEQLSTLAFRARPQDGGPDFYHRRLATASTILDRLADGSYAPEVIALRGGSFMRGDPQGDDDEKPPMPVSVAAFAIGISEVTFEQYDRFCEDTRKGKPDDGEWGRGRRPVINVSWKDAVAYTDWLSRKTGQTYRLPSDAEWEYAARAGTASRFWWGDTPGAALANCEGCGSLWDGDQTATVGSFPPNPFGLYDTAGNVFEWVADCYHTSFEHAPADGAALDKEGCGKRVIRGGAWSFPPAEIRSANRWRDFPTRHSDDTGFRVVRELENMATN